jgi:hypothetical protein
LFGVLENQHQFVDTIDFILNALDQWTESIGDVIDQCVGDPIRSDRYIVSQLFNPSPDVQSVGCRLEMELVEDYLDTLKMKNTLTERMPSRKTIIYMLTGSR